MAAHRPPFEVTEKVPNRKPILQDTAKLKCIIMSDDDSRTDCPGDVCMGVPFSSRGDRTSDFDDFIKMSR